MESVDGVVDEEPHRGTDIAGDGRGRRLEVTALRDGVAGLRDASTQDDPRKLGQLQIGHHRRSWRSEAPD